MCAIAMLGVVPCQPDPTRVHTDNFSAHCEATLTAPQKTGDRDFQSSMSDIASQDRTREPCPLPRPAEWEVHRSFYACSTEVNHREITCLTAKRLSRSRLRGGILLFCTAIRRIVEGACTTGIYLRGKLNII
jgi:hypothetical protein